MSTVPPEAPEAKPAPLIKHLRRALTFDQEPTFGLARISRRFDMALHVLRREHERRRKLRPCYAPPVAEKTS